MGDLMSKCKEGMPCCGKKQEPKTVVEKVEEKVVEPVKGKMEQLFSCCSTNKKKP